MYRWLDASLPTLRVHLEEHNTCTQVVLEGELDAATCPWARHLLDQLTAEAPRRSAPARTDSASATPCAESAVEPPVWLVDVAGLHFVSAAGLRLLEGAARRCRRAGGTLILTRPSPVVLRALQRSGSTATFYPRDAAPGLPGRVIDSARLG